MAMFKTALLQMVSGKNQDENQKKGIDFCRRAKDMGADLALFPEMWSTGYEIREDSDWMKKAAITIDSPFISVFRELARELNMSVMTGSFQKVQESSC